MILSKLNFKSLKQAKIFLLPFSRQIREKRRSPYLGLLNIERGEDKWVKEKESVFFFSTQMARDRGAGNGKFAWLCILIRVCCMILLPHLEWLGANEVYFCRTHKYSFVLQWGSQWVPFQEVSLFQTPLYLFFLLNLVSYFSNLCVILSKRSLEKLIYFVFYLFSNLALFFHFFQ